MTGYKKYFDAYCREHGLNLYLSFEMPAGYETAKGTFDASSRTVFINAEGLDKEPEYERMFYLFHELRHASQYLEPERFNETINRSVQYIIMFDGTCYKLVENHYLKCKLEACISDNRMKSMRIHLPMSRPEKSAGTRQG